MSEKRESEREMSVSTDVASAAIASGAGPMREVRQGEDVGVQGLSFVKDMSLVDEDGDEAMEFFYVTDTGLRKRTPGASASAVDITWATKNLVTAIEKISTLTAFEGDSQNSREKSLGQLEEDDKHASSRMQELEVLGQEIRRCFQRQNEPEIWKSWNRCMHYVSLIGNLFIRKSAWGSDVRIAWGVSQGDDIHMCVCVCVCVCMYVCMYVCVCVCVCA